MRDYSARVMFRANLRVANLQTKLVEAMARGLSEAQREALIECTPWDVCVGAGPAIAFCANGFLQDSTITDDGVELTPLGLAVRAYLEKTDGQ